MSVRSFLPMNGTAYAFFKCTHPPEHITLTIPDVRDEIGTPSELEISLLNDPRTLQTEDQTLKRFTEKAHAAGLNYLIEAKLPDKHNLETAAELGSIIGTLHKSTNLYEKGETFCGRVIYHDGKEWQEYE